MKKIKSTLLLLTALFVATIVKAQSIEEGKKFFYYEKYLSAKSVFSKLLQDNPNNTDAAYWLGLTMISGDENKDWAGAKALFQKTLAANSNSALLTAAMGHIALNEGNIADARSRFEIAISLSQGKDIEVLNAIGRANGDFDSKNGDAAYAVEKLTQATNIKKFKDPSTYCLLGDAYRKQIDGGNAVLSYQKALAIDPQYARANYRLGKVYQTQGSTQSDIFLKYYNNTIAADPNYGPVYYNLYNYYYQTDATKAGDYLDKYLSVMGNDEPKACYFRASQKYAEGKFQDVIAKSTECINGAGASPYPKLYGLMGYAYDKLNDSINTKKSFEQYFKLADPSILGSGDYKKYAETLLKFSGNEALAGTYINKAVDADTTEAGKVALLKSMASSFEGQQKYLDAATWYQKVLNVKKNPTRTDIFKCANNFSAAGNYPSAVDTWNMYNTKYPNETYGYYNLASAQSKIDTVMAGGLAVSSYQKTVDLAEAQWVPDSAKVKYHLLNSYQYLIQYYYNIKKDKKTAADLCTKYLVKDPSNVEVQGYKKMFESAGSSRPATPPAPKPSTKAAAPKTTASASKSKTTTVVKKV